MTYFQAIIFGIIQGFTEFLPISSDGHLMLGRLLFSDYPQPLLNDILLHAGSLLAIIWFFRRNLKTHLLKLTPQLLLSTLPAVIFGLLVYQRGQVLLTDSRLLGPFFLVTSLFLFIFGYLNFKKTKLNQTSFRQALLVGLFQALAILPGVSRSASTLMAGKLAGLDSKATFTYAFLTALPAIGGAIILAVREMSVASIQVTPIHLISLIVSFLTSLLALKLLALLFERRNLMPFALYTFFLGLVTLAFFN